MKKLLYKALQYVLFLGLGLLLVYWSVRNFTASDWQNIRQAFANGNYAWLAAAFVCILFSHWLRAVRWQHLIKASYKHYLGIVNTTAAVLINYLINLAFPRLGEVSRCGVVNKYDKIPMSIALGTVVAERVIDVILLFLFTVLMFFWQADTIGVYAHQKIIAPIEAKFANLTQTGWGTFILLLAIALIIGLAWFMKRRLQQFAVYNKLKSLALSFIKGVVAVQKVQRPLLFWVSSILIWVGYYLAIMACFKVTSFTDTLSWGAAFAVLIVGSYGMIATQGGIGAYQLLVSGLLVLYGLEQTLAYGFSWLLWSAQTFLSVFLGFIGLVGLPIINKQNKANTTATTNN
ncbi:MAG: flippase-like domain-containing protein [Sphingobacteriales bacterium]|nr:flippase-like domain-containing protein [Sphingobacteriales bacterium]